ncbi:2,5-diamino-6-ribosylamino-4(3H)-pyrimidinone 5'-phosphate reductase [Mycobacterium marinum]|uniref:2,5-diamino-6-ribosylamino-4(3H)-pyrimidinone 5'-phosphate reductase n=2 Tax=Mycobacterium ulcerans group TaxID=2993898 RepID=A0A2Z5YD95_MYCMR|nr:MULTISPECIES: pyrimidine reductase family protein [Mycobacterium ulcerans group]AXN44000.1 2,5-diamino-6-ribosylamino-4(3H)-pyrimidinone 5'-phosphate reductase [Mycobacterium marinum]AXN49370.1 2,5-diamino-6-ribosylamino-4(3H)-pyrimidinone 5'-phosphate reductase [Mycobacterium marinum]EPQ79676.1 5-amino-6-(5-phosphoribosylamino)uracil reductase [Mycobacterium marinum str. Europe]MDC8992538.1 pyrimidine reductase family protein [Mycobacterium marinum]QYL29493.1 2,5-diamino-6-ribosylamino-4(3
MPDPTSGRSADAQLTLLGTDRQLTDEDLPEFYGYPAKLSGTWLRANFITSLDGGATVGGTSGGLAGPGDRAVFVLLRELADVILVGAGTVRIEGYSGAQLGVAERQQRQARGQSEVPQLAIATNTGQLDRDLPVFTRTEVPPLVLTAAAAVYDTRRRLTGLAEVVDCSGKDPHRVDEGLLLARLAGRGMRRILTEGGPTLFGSLIEQDLLDELCLTIAPVVVGGLPRRIASGPGQLQTRMHCAHVITDDAGYLYTRYVRA